MSEYENATYGRRTIPSAEAQAVDQGLRAYMIGVYQYMALGVALTGAIAYVLSSQPEIMQMIWGTPLKWVAIFAPLPVALYTQFRIHSLNPSTAQALFWLYAALVGVSFTVLFAMGRLPGWIAHWMEMHGGGPSKICRPRQIYTGVKERSFVPIEKRYRREEDRGFEIRNPKHEIRNKLKTSNSKILKHRFQIRFEFRFLNI